MGTPISSGGLGGVLDDGGAVFPGEREHAEDAADAGHAVVLVDVGADRADVGAGGLRARQKRQRRARRPRGAVVVVDLVLAAPGAQMLAQQLTRLRRQEPDVEIIPLHLDALARASPAGRRSRRPRLRRSR